jgi:hypothetical protein
MSSCHYSWKWLTLRYYETVMAACQESRSSFRLSASYCDKTISFNRGIIRYKNQGRNRPTGAAKTFTSILHYQTKQDQQAIITLIFYNLNIKKNVLPLKKDSLSMTISKDLSEVLPLDYQGP